MSQPYDGMDISKFPWMKDLKEIRTGRGAFKINHATGRLEQHDLDNFFGSSNFPTSKGSRSVAASAKNYAAGRLEQQHASDKILLYSVIRSPASKESQSVATPVEPTSNGSQSAATPAENYEPGDPRAISLSSCVGDTDKDGTLLFSHDVRIPLDFKKPKLHSKPLPLYHAHVLWSYVVELDKSDDGDVFNLKVVSEGTRLTRNNAKYMFNDIPGLAAPKDITVSLRSDRLQGELVLTPSSDGSFACARPITKQELLAAGDDPLVLTARFAVPRAYFDLPAILESTKSKRTAASPNAHLLVAQILSLGWPPGNDWEITTGTAAKLYMVHKAVFEPHLKHTRAHLEVLIRNGRVRLTGYSDAELRMIIRICYGVDVPLPGPAENVEQIVVNMCTFFGEGPSRSGVFKGVVVPHWQREICRKALALDTRNPSPSSIAELLSLLHIIWEAPIGYFPVAKRVAIGVLADMMHLSAYRSIDRFERELVTPALKFLPNQRNVSSIIKSMKLHFDSISMVDKRMEVRVENQEEKPKELEENKKKEENEETDTESFPANPSPWTDCTIL